jgi:hypothetical protein
LGANFNRNSLKPLALPRDTRAANKNNDVSEGLDRDSRVEIKGFSDAPPKPSRGKNAAPAGGRDGKDERKINGDFHSTEIEPRASLSDGVLIALDGVVEVAPVLILEATALLAAAAAADIGAVEARLWTLRRALKEAIATWREAVPSLEIAGRAA